MRVAALYDIHGNLPALEAVLEELDRGGIDRIVIGGDVAYGPQVRGTLDRLLALGNRAVWLRGNADRELVEFYDHVAAPQAEDIRLALDWEARSIERRHRDFLAALPMRLTLDVEGLGPVLFCHGSPRSDEEIVTRLTPETRLRGVLARVQERTVICGHTHVQFDREVGSVRVLNAGSVGLPYDAPGAYWALLGPQAELRRTPYDRDLAVARIRASGHPLSGTFIANLEQPTSDGEASAWFEQLAVQREAEIRE
jgi:putative phosphoesterase